jgi:hypothetical protein
MLQTAKRQIERPKPSTIFLLCQCPACKDLFSMEALIDGRGGMTLLFHPKVGLGNKLPYHRCIIPGGDHRIQFFHS